MIRMDVVKWDEKIEWHLWNHAGAYEQGEDEE